MTASPMALAPIAFGIVLACAPASAASAASAESAEPQVAPSLPPAMTLAIANQGGELEGHTPTGFAGMGTGLFAGDDLNPGFPEGVGVQTYLTFDLPPELEIGSARIVSDALHISGTPFEDLGALIAEPVDYAVFGPSLFELEAIGPAATCSLASPSSIVCEVTAGVMQAVDDGKARVQFRIRFEQPADNDGCQDLALFFRTDSNTNEAGIFELLIEG